MNLELKTEGELHFQSKFEKTAKVFHFHREEVPISTASDILCIPYLGINKEIFFETDKEVIWINRESLKFLQTIDNIHGIKYEVTDYEAHSVLGVVSIKDFVHVDFDLGFDEEDGLKVEYTFIGDFLGNIRNYGNPKLKLSKDFEKFLSDGEFTDLTLLCEGGELKAHKAILSARSKVFKAMFRQEEFLESKTQTIKSCFDLESMNCLLLYIYSGKLNMSKAKELLELADYYDLDQLKDECACIILDGINFKNVISTLVLADTHHARHLKSEALLFLRENKEKVINEEELLKLEKTKSLNPELVQEMLKAVKECDCHCKSRYSYN